jgi:hypothetical protein
VLTSISVWVFGARKISLHDKAVHDPKGLGAVSGANGPTSEKFRTLLEEAETSTGL